MGEYLNICFSKEGRKMTVVHKKIFSTLFAISEIQIKITMRYHPITIRMPPIKKKKISEYKLLKRLTVTALTHSWWECKIM